MTKKLLLGLAVLGGLLLVVLTALVVWFDPEDHRERIAGRASEALGREVVLNGPMSLSWFPWLALEISEVTVGNPPGFGDAPELVRIGRARASLRLAALLRGQVEIGAIGLSDAQLSLVRSRDGQSNLDGLFGQSRKPAGEPLDLSVFSLGATVLENVSVEQLDLGTGQRSGFYLERLDLDPFRSDQATVFVLRGRSQGISGDGIEIERLAGRLSVDGDLGRVRVADLEARFVLSGADLSGSLSGSLDIRLEPSPSLRVESLTIEMVRLDQRLSVVADQAVTLSLADPPRLEFTERGVLVNRQALRAAGEMVFGQPPRLVFSVTGDELDLRPWLIADNTSGPDASEPPVGGGSQAPEIDAQLGLTLGRLYLSDGLVLDELEAAARLTDGRLDLAPLQARLLGGRFEGRAQIDFTVDPPAVLVAPRLESIQVGEIAALSGSAAPVTGIGNLDLDLRFRGLAGADLLASLDGTGRLEISDGAVEGVDLRELIEQGLINNNLANVRRAFRGRTEFEQLSGLLEIRNGVLALPDLVVKLGLAQASGSGRLALGSGEVDYRLELNLGPEWTARLPELLRRGSRGRIPLTIQGPVTGPMVGVDVERLIQNALIGQAEEGLLRALESRDDAASDPPADGSADDGSGAPAEGEETDQPRRQRGRDLLLRTLLERSGEKSSEQSEQAEEQDPPVDR